MLYSRKRKMNGRGFTLIELLVVILILAILMAVALPLYLSSIANSQTKTCRANLQTIANAIHAARTQNPSLTDYSTFSGALSTSGTVVSCAGGATIPDLQNVPVCPTGGSYSVTAPATAGAANFMVSCSTHGAFTPGVSAQ